uniref:NADH-ubiquinone oxidoreductase chain 3 n=1 Tax=Coridius brunneus TaxID=696877 RepID=A0A8E7BA44_9HEMI|nr:NADH dehydrogenase subunit 3 [Coridius brunneus]
MMYVLMTIIIAMAISLLLMISCSIISKTSSYDRESMSPFECGFDPMSSARTPFSIQFFLIAILFLIFDIEIAILLPIMLTMKLSVTKTWIMTMMMFMSILILGLYYEWKNGVLEWAK